MNNKKTTRKVAAIAAKVLNDNNSSKIKKELAGSALSQYNSTNQTGSVLESKASMVMNSTKYSEETKTLAASVLSQSNKKR